MIGEILAEHAWLWPFLWQSTAFLAAGLGGSYLLLRRPARAHHLLFIAMIVAVAVPALSRLVKQREWGLFEAPASVPLATEALAFTTTEQRTAIIEVATPHSVNPGPLTNVAPAPASSPFDWLRLLFGLWAITCVILLARLAIRFGLGIRLVKQATAAKPGPVEIAIGIASNKLGIDQDIAARRSDRVRSPMIWCWSRRPILLIPADTSRNDSQLDLVGIVCHELAHWKRRDHVTGLLAELVLAVLPWQLLLWWASRRLVGLSEEACDDWVLACGRPGVDYAETLLTLTPHGHAALAPAVVSSKKGLRGRIQRILQERCASPHSGLCWSLAATVLATCLAVGIAFAQTRPAKPQTEAPVANAMIEATEDGSVDANEVRLRLIDADGRPVQGAKVATSVRIRERAVLGSRLSWRRAETSNEDGQVTFSIANRFRPQMDREAVYILHEDRKLGAMLELERSDAGKSLDVLLVPVCQVRGTVDSPTLKAIGMPLASTSVYVAWHDRRPLNHMLDADESFTFLLPPGPYELTLYGGGTSGEDPPRLSASTKYQIMPFEVLQDQRDLDLGAIALPPTKLATLIGQPAPELGPIQAWKNGSPVTLTDLKGQTVYLYFDGDSPNTSRDLPPLVELHEALGDKGLTIIALYNCASLEELDRNWQEVHQRFGGVTEVPFRMAVDGGEPTFYEGTDRERPGATYGRYDITGIPTSVLIDPAGRIAGEINLHSAKETISAMLGAVPDEPETQAWRAVFEAVYRLEEGEVLRRIAPPFIPERMEFYRTEDAHQAELIPRGPDHMTFHWDGKLRRWGMGFGRVRTLGGVLNRVLRLKRFEYDGPDELLGLELPGDWIVRDERPREVKLRALEALLETELGRKIRFEKRPVEREVIVAAGRFKFHPPVGTYENTSVHMYADEVDPDEGSGGGTADSLAEFLQKLGNRVNLTVIDRTESIEEMSIPYRHHRSSAVFREPDEQEQARKLRLVLDHLTEQTELQFEVTTQPVEVWFATEEASR